MPKPTAESLAGRILSRLGIAGRIAADPAYAAWRSGQPSVAVDGRTFYVSGGDMLVDENELMLGWAVETGLADAASVRAAQREIGSRGTPGDGGFLDFSE